MQHCKCSQKKEKKKKRDAHQYVLRSSEKLKPWNLSNLDSCCVQYLCDWGPADNKDRERKGACKEFEWSLHHIQNWQITFHFSLQQRWPAVHHNIQLNPFGIHCSSSTQTPTSPYKTLNWHVHLPASFFFAFFWDFSFWLITKRKTKTQNFFVLFCF